MTGLLFQTIDSLVNKCQAHDGNVPAMVGSTIEGGLDWNGKAIYGRSRCSNQGHALGLAAVSHRSAQNRPPSVPSLEKPSARTAIQKPRGRGRPPGDTREQTRAAIVVAAQDAFARLGFAQATNREIASLAGVTASAIYPYFESKAALYLAVVRDSIAQITPELRRAIADAQGTEDAIRRLLRALGSVDEGRVAVTRFLAGVPIEMQRNPELSEGLLAEPGEVFAIVVDIVNRGVQAGEVHPERAPRVISFVITSMMGLSAYGMTLGAAHLELAVEGLIDLLDGTLFSSSSPTPPAVKSHAHGFQRSSTRS